MQPVTSNQTDTESYLSKFGHGAKISITELWQEMDRVWDGLELDNNKLLADQDVAKFYSHPVWTLNGLFSSIDPDSIQHRESISKYISKLSNQEGREFTIADFGGGSGVLADMLINTLGISYVDIIEPWPSDYFVKMHVGKDKIHFLDNSEPAKYDVSIAQDVLEHLEDPIEFSLNCIDATKVGGILIFANCFYPVIKCHLPSTFYLRHIFRFVMHGSGLKYRGRVPGAEHALVFQRTGSINYKSILLKSDLAKYIGLFLNRFSPLLSLSKRKALSIFHHDN